MGADQEEASFLRVKPFLADIQKHCLSLTKNDWDAQDLLQETLTKVYRSLQKAPGRQLTKAFLRQIATNAWIDHCRKGKANEHRMKAHPAKRKSTKLDVVVRLDWYQKKGSSNFWLLFVRGMPMRFVKRTYASQSRA
ncbi:RNA polymerase sigma factor [Brevibacillus sp. AG]|uniref:RNA polymerase sigma factor n=1 Tax=Brevibacillus sp. AG TaxID=3020891 RepID=UPI000AB17A4C|nr:RNA polymerase sigma factor [Brevibacillus sp. AG]MDC0761924.1 RNA polymerase sigma factor [Brevibacillus sp. AG]